MFKIVGCLAVLGAGAVACIYWVARLMVDREDYSMIEYEDPAFV